MTKYIYIKGAKVHNLKNIDVKIPKNKLVTITGISGSGKSSLAFDTIYAEGQRRYVESLSTYARQFLGIMEKPDVELIEGLSPSIAIDQKTLGHNPRSTVGTVTEIYDYLRLLFAKIGNIYCYKCNQKIEPQTPQQIVDKILDISKAKNQCKVILLAPLIRQKRGTFDKLLDDLRTKGFARIRLDGEIKAIELNTKLYKNKKHNIDVVVDRIIIPNYYDLQQSQDFFDLKQRVTDSVETCLRLSNGEIIIYLPDENAEVLFSEKSSCSKCSEVSYPRIEPNLFSFNSPQGACPKCHGLGEIMEIDHTLIFNPNLTILEGGIFPLAKSINSENWQIKVLKAFAKKKKISLSTKIKDLDQNILHEILFGSDTEVEVPINEKSIKGKYKTKFEGVIPNLYRKYKETDSEIIKKEIEKYMITKICNECSGQRLKKEALSIKIQDKNIIDVTNMKIEECLIWVENILNKIKNTENENNRNNQEKVIALPILNEIQKRLKFLFNVGLGYISLSRSTRTLSGGEAQRIKLASQIGTGLSGVIYVLDEPSVGLHQRDNDKLIKTLKELRDMGNTIIVVEHDEDTIMVSDWIIELGPGAGSNGGNLIYSGNIKDLKFVKNSITSDYLYKRKIVGQKYLNKQNKNKSRLIKSKKFIEIYGARANNLKNINVSFPLEKFVCVTGVSGSGKSTLVNDILNNYLHNKFYNSKRNVGEHDYIKGIEFIDKVVNIDQNPIGRTPRSNPITYIGLFQDIRNLFANTREAKIRGYSISRFSFNVKGGRCENCKGDGVMKVEMQFLPDVYVTCDICEGKRYNRETLEIEYKNKNIFQVLDMTVDEAINFFENKKKIQDGLKLLKDVGLGYIKLGQPATTLSGGEAQRIKLAAELKKKSTGQTLYILDEPTTGLHSADIDQLLGVLHKLVDLGNTVIVVEHNLDVIKTADWIIDLGPESGDWGGEIVAEGTVEDIMNNLKSHTGFYLKKILS